MIRLVLFLVLTSAHYSPISTLVRSLVSMSVHSSLVLKLVQSLVSISVYSSVLTFDVCTFLVCIEAGAVLGVIDAGTVLGVDVCTSPANLVAGTVLGVNVCTSLANLNTGGGPWCRRLHITSQSRRWTPAHSY